MSFLNPSGLWGLIGIPILIIIYIIRSPYQEKVVSSSFIWKLSLKYQKKRQPLKIMNRYLLFILQVLTIAVISLMLARPVIETGDGSDEKIVILDLSASMGASENGVTSFDNAIEDIKELISKQSEAAKMTIITAGEEAECVISRASSAYEIEKALDEITYEHGSADIAGALKLAAEVREKNPDAEVVFYTDEDYDEPEDMETVNVSVTDDNAAVLSLVAEADDDKEYVYTSEIANYGSGKSLTAALYVDDELVDAQIVEVGENSTTSVEWAETGITYFDKAQVFIEADDALTEDNEYYLYNNNQKTYKVQIVSAAPGFIKSALKAFGCYEVTLASELKDAATTGFDLYIYDGMVPDQLPQDGAIWFLNPESLPEDIPVTIGETKTGNFDLAYAPDSDTELYTQLTQYFNPESIGLAEYREITGYGDFESLFTCGETPVIVAGTVNNIRTVVFSFDLHNSNLPLKIDFLGFLASMQSYLLPAVTDSNIYTVGDTVNIEAASGANEISLESEQDTQIYNEFPASYKTYLPGLYTIRQTINGGTELNNEFFVHLSQNESNLVLKGTNPDTSVLTVDEDIEVTFKKEIWEYLAALLLLLLVLEWEVQYREQY